MLFGIIGNGFVGQATQLLASEKNKCLVYDVDPEKCSPLGTTLLDISSCQVIFICVPTPIGDNGSCDTSIVEKVVEQLQRLCDSSTFIVCRSTVIMGTCDRLNVYHMPEFLTEKNWLQDFLNCQDWIFGWPIRNSAFETSITQLITDSPVSGNIHFVQNKCSEMCKYARNTFLATKIGFCNEIASVCEKLDINYDKVAELFAADPRIGTSHIAVPGPDGNRGFGGHCLPKDLAATVAFMETRQIQSIILSAVQQRNQSDREADPHKV